MEITSNRVMEKCEHLLRSKFSFLKALFGDKVFLVQQSLLKEKYQWKSMVSEIFAQKKAATGKKIA